MTSTRMLASDKWDAWCTPPDLFAKLNAEFQFDCDLAASDRNHLLANYFTQAQDSLLQTWRGRCFCNPPYGRKLGDWLQKAWTSVVDDTASVVVMLLPAYTDVRWFHMWALGKCEVRFVRGRLAFVGGSTAPFASMVCVYGKNVPPRVVSIWQ